MRRLAIALLGASLLVFWVVPGCEVRNYQRCDQEFRDCLPGFHCVMETHDCEPNDDGGGGDDLGMGDLEPIDGAAPDGSDLSPECTMTQSCGDPARPICDTQSGMCRVCSSTNEDSQCALHAGAAHCEVDGGRCVECTDNSQCSTNTPVCGSDNKCRTCAKDSECATDVCKSNGQCGTTLEVYYVDNGGRVVADCVADTSVNHDGLSKATAFCDIQTALTTRQYIKVYGHATFPYGQVHVTSNNFVIIGPGVDNANPVTIYGTGSNPDVWLDVSGTSSGSLTLQGVQAGIRGMTSISDAVACSNSGSGTATLVMKNGAAYDGGSTHYGVNSSNCRLTLDGNKIGYNTGGGINLGAGTVYTVTNNFIYRSSGTGVLIDSSASPAHGVFQFNTVANNTKVAAGGGGVECGSASPLLEFSIFYGDKANGSASESFGNCVFAQSDVGATDPMFTSGVGDDYRISEPSLIDQVSMTVDGGGMTLPNHDFFGTTRPVNGSSDIGAYEKP